MKTKRLTPFILAGVLAGSLSGCMAMTDGLDTVSGGVYTTYYPYGTPVYGPDYGYYNPVIAPPPSSRPVSGPPAWGYPAGAPGRPNAAPVRPAPAPSPFPGGGSNVTPPSPGTPSRPSSGSSNGQRPGANVVNNNRPAPTTTPSSSGGATGTHNSGSRR